MTYVNIYEKKSTESKINPTLSLTLGFLCQRITERERHEKTLENELTLYDRSQSTIRLFFFASIYQILFSKVMEDRLRLIGEIFQAIENNADGHDLWNLLEELTNLSHDGIVYMTYAGETPESLARKYHRQHLVKLIQLHQKLTSMRIHFS